MKKKGAATAAGRRRIPPQSSRGVRRQFAGARQGASGERLQLQSAHQRGGFAVNKAPQEHRVHPGAVRGGLSMARSPRAADVSPDRDEQTDHVEINTGGNRDRVAQRAYERYEARGREDGRDQEDWFEAEREVDEDDGNFAA
jgi:hypothetical protein